jgi:hypothetical protein
MTTRQTLSTLLFLFATSGCAEITPERYSTLNETEATLVMDWLGAFNHAVVQEVLAEDSQLDWYDNGYVEGVWDGTGQEVFDRLTGPVTVWGTIDTAWSTEEVFDQQRLLLEVDLALVLSEVSIDDMVTVTGDFVHQIRMHERAGKHDRTEFLYQGDLQFTGAVEGTYRVDYALFLADTGEQSLSGRGKGTVGGQEVDIFVNDVAPVQMP